MAESAEDWKAKGNAALSSKNFSEAVDCYTKAIELDSSNHVYFSNRSAAELSSGDAEAALTDAEKCIELNKSWPKGYGRKGAALHTMKRYDDAIAAYEEGLKVDPSNAALTAGIESVRKDKQFASSRQAGGMFGGGNPFGANMLSRLAADPKFASYLQDPSFHQAMESLQQNPNNLSAAQNDPRVVEAIGYLLGIPLQQPSPQQAASMYEDQQRREREEEEKRVQREAEEKARREEEERKRRLAEETPEEREKRERKERAQAKKQEGNTHYKKKEFEEALKLYDEALEIDPENITYRLNKAAVYCEQGNLDESLKECKEAIEFGRSVFAPFSLIAKAYARIGNVYAKQDKLELALEAYQDSLTESFNDAVNNKVKQLKKTIADREAEAYRDPEKAAEAKEKGNELFKGGEFAKAIECYTEAIKRNPDSDVSAVYFTNRAAARTKIMDISGAMSDCQQAIKLNPKYAKVYARKGALHMLLKEYHKAMETYEQGLQLDPENFELKDGLRRVMMKINETNATGEADPERAKRAMEDPEIQAILRDPMVNQALQDMQSDPKAAQQVFQDPTMATKLQKLVAAGVLQMR